MILTPKEIDCLISSYKISNTVIVILYFILPILEFRMKNSNEWYQCVWLDYSDSSWQTFILKAI